MFDFFKSKPQVKAEDARSDRKNKLIALLKDKTSGRIDSKTFINELKVLAPDDWQTYLDSNTLDLLHITKQFNESLINLIEYKEKLKELDYEQWKKYASPEEREVTDAQDEFENGEITYVEMCKRIATAEKRPFFSISEVSVDEEKEGRPFYFAFEWNEFFIDDLKKRGYTGNIDSEYVEAWWTHMCTIIAAESDAVIVTNPMEYRKIKTLEGNKTEHY